jgi:DNA-binding MarR family transcriptional regulator
MNTRSLPTGSAAMSKADFEKLAHLRHELRRFHRFSEALTHRRGVTMLEYQLMLQIKGYPGRDWVSVGELADRLEAMQHGVVALVSRCEAAGLVKRSVSASDKRRVEVRLTGEGEECLEALAQLHHDELSMLSTVFEAGRAKQESP